jgi:hypothetical protein
MKIPNIFVSESEDEIKNSLANCIKLSQKFILKNRDYKLFWKIFQLNNEAYSLVVKLVKKDSSLTEEGKDFYSYALDTYYGLLADKIHPKW